MIDRHPWLDALAHAVLIAGILIVAFPVYVAVIASTHGPNDFMSGLVPLLPGGEMVANYRSMLTDGLSSSGAPPIRSTRQPVATSKGRPFRPRCAYSA